MTAISLRVLQIWQEEGAQRVHFSPVMNFAGEANKGINNHANPSGKTMDAEGNNYYTSHPPFAFILPYFCFEVLQLEANVLNLQLFNLLFSILSCFIVYAIAQTIFSANRRYALISLAFYAFSPAVLWFQTNTYMSDILVHFFFLLQVLLFLKVRTQFSKTSAALLFITSFLMIYTSWLGVLSTSIAVTLLFLSHSTLGKRRWLLAICGILTIGAALTLILVQYAQINGWNSIWEHFSYRFQVRGSNSIENQDNLFFSKLREIGTILFNYTVNFGLLTLLFLLFLTRWRKKAAVKMQELKPFLALAIVPVVLLNVLLLNYCGQDFTVLYGSIFLSIIAAFMLSTWKLSHQTVILAIILSSNIVLYYGVNRPGDTSWKGDRYDASLKLAQKIVQTVPKNEVAVFFGEDIDPMTLVYAKRNVLVVKDSLELQQELEMLRVKEYTVINP